MKWIKYFEEIQDLTRPNMEKKPFEQPTTNYNINIKVDITEDKDLISDIFLEMKEKWKLDDNIGENPYGNSHDSSRGFCRIDNGSNRVKLR